MSEPVACTIHIRQRLCACLPQAWPCELDLLTYALALGSCMAHDALHASKLTALHAQALHSVLLACSTAC